MNGSGMNIGVISAESFATGKGDGSMHRRIDLMGRRESRTNAGETKFWYFVVRCVIINL